MTDRGAIGAPHRALTFTIVAMVALSAMFALAFVADPRALPNGENVWLKPLRFGLAFAIHTATLLWLSHLTSRGEVRDAWFAWSVWLQICVMFVELACIGVQAGRGVASHFNYATAFDRAVFTVMGIGTAGLFLGFAMMVVGLVRRPARGVTGMAAMIAMTYALLGGLAGVAMVMPSAPQAALLDQGIRPDVIGTHVIGVVSGLSVPFFSWDLSAGDWRVPHFLGLHALQTIPFVAWLLQQQDGPRARQAVWLSTLGYGQIFVWSVTQTLQGQSLFRPDGLNITVILVGAVIYASGVGLAVQGRLLARNACAARTPDRSA